MALQRPAFACLVVVVLLCLVFVIAGFSALIWYFVSLRNDSDTTENQGHGTRHSSNVTKAELSTIAQIIWDKDVTRLSETEYVIDVQMRTQLLNRTDLAPMSLFMPLSFDIKDRSPTYRSLSKLFDNYNAQARQAETTSPEEEREIDDYLDAVLNTEIMKETKKFLQRRGFIENSARSFRELLWNLWFRPYSRSSKYNATDSSGFEHIFVGEIKGSQVSGYHSWIKYYLDEFKGDLNYMGYYDSYDEPRALTFKFKWNDKLKKVGGFFIGTSPEFDMSLFTLCILTRPNKECQFDINNSTVYITTWDVGHVPGLQVATAYPKKIVTK